VRYLKVSAFQLKYRELVISSMNSIPKIGSPVSQEIKNTWKFPHVARVSPGVI
jgi:hypothetical protein